MGKRKIVVQIKTRRIREYEKAEVIDDHPKLGQHPLGQSKIAATVSA